MHRMIHTPAIPSVVELEFWSRPGSKLFLPGGKELAARCRTDLNLKASVILGLNFASDPVDLRNLLTAIDSGEIDANVVRSFFDERQLDSTAANHDLAARFLAQSYGQQLAWLHIPNSQEGLSLLESLFAWAHTHELVVVEPYREYCVFDPASAAMLFSAASPSVDLWWDRPAQVHSETVV